MPMPSPKEIDALALGLTRPSMFMGVTLQHFFINLMLCTLICVDAHTFWGIPLFGLIHLTMLRLCRKDPKFFPLYLKAIIKTPPVLNFWLWGKTNSYGPY